jgi:hypothetical protein
LIDPSFVNRNRKLKKACTSFGGCLKKKKEKKQKEKTNMNNRQKLVYPERSKYFHKDIEKIK